MQPDVDDPLHQQHNTLNPYRLGAGFMLRRLRWDLNPQSWRSRALLRSWKNRHANVCSSMPRATVGRRAPCTV